MAGVLNAVYSVVVLLVAVVGVTFVFATTSGGSERDDRYSRWSVVVAVTLFLAVMVWTLAFSGIT